jgi:hypothetical protein
LTASVEIVQESSLSIIHHSKIHSSSRIQHHSNDATREKKRKPNDQPTFLRGESLLSRNIPKSTSEGNALPTDDARRYASIDRVIVGVDGNDEDGFATLGNRAVSDASAVRFLLPSATPESGVRFCRRKSFCYILDVALLVLLYRVFRYSTK